MNTYIETATERAVEEEERKKKGHGKEKTKYIPFLS